MQVVPGESVAAAIARCPEGGSLLLLPGEHVAGEERLEIDHSLHAFGRGAATLRLRGRNGIRLSAAATTLDGLRLVGREDMDVVVRIEGASALPRLQGVEIDAGGATRGIFICRGAAPTISRCRIAGVRNDGTGVSFYDQGTAGRLVGCDIDMRGVRGDSTGIFVSRAAPRISGCSVRGATYGIFSCSRAGGRLEGTTIEGCRRGVIMMIDDGYGACTPELAAGNVFRGNRRGDIVRLPAAQGAAPEA